MNRIHVDGREVVPILLYSLSTCGWCKRTKLLLNELGVAYDYIDLNEIEADQVEGARTEVRKWNPKCSLPTLVIHDKECIVGFQEARIRELVQPCQL